MRLVGFSTILRLYCVNVCVLMFVCGLLCLRQWREGHRTYVPRYFVHYREVRAMYRSYLCFFFVIRFALLAELVNHKSIVYSVERNSKSICTIFRISVHRILELLNTTSEVFRYNLDIC